MAKIIISTVTILLLTSLFCVALGKEPETKVVVITTFEVRSLEEITSDKFTAFPQGGDIILYVEKGLEPNNTELKRTIQNFNFHGSPMGMLNALRNQGIRISYPRVLGDTLDNVSEVTIKNFNGTLLDILVQSIPGKYAKLSLVALVAKPGDIIVRFSGGTAKTPRLATPEGIPFEMPKTPPAKK